MTEYFVGAYWDARKESRNSCAARLYHFLNKMSSLSAELSCWYAKGATRREALRPILLEQAELEHLLKSSTTDANDAEFAELGYHLSCWNGKDVALEATLGATNPYVANAVVITAPATCLQSLLNDILDAEVSVFEPEDAVISTDGLLASSGLPVRQADAIARYKRSAE